MTNTVEQLEFTPKGGQPRLQEIHRTSFGMSKGRDGAACLNMWIETTRPGETPDDRGVEGWDASVQIAVTTDPIDLASIGPSGIDIANVLEGEKWGERFLYHWDHSDFMSVRMSIRPVDGQWAISFSGKSYAGDSVSFKARVLL